MEFRGEIELVACGLELEGNINHKSESVLLDDIEFKMPSLSQTEKFITISYSPQSKTLQRLKENPTRLKTQMVSMRRRKAFLKWQFVDSSSSTLLVWCHKPSQNSVLTNLIFPTFISSPRRRNKKSDVLRPKESQNVYFIRALGIIVANGEIHRSHTISKWIRNATLLRKRE